MAGARKFDLRHARFLDEKRIISEPVSAMKINRRKTDAAGV